MGAPLDRQLSIQFEDLHAFPALGRVVVDLALGPHELVSEQARLDDAEVLAFGVVSPPQHFGGGKHGVAGLQRRGVSTGRVDGVAECIVADVWT